MFVALAALMVLLEGAAIVHQHHETTPPKSESWDQENLKRNDHGCPTAIFFVNPSTHLLEQCR